MKPDNIFARPFTELPSTDINCVGSDNASMQSTADVRQESQVCTSLELNPYLRAYDFKVFVRDGVAKLSGLVSEGGNKELATLLALAVEGINQVNNQVVVKSDGVEPMASIERSHDEMIEDANITAAIKSKLMSNQYGNGLSSDVDTVCGKVTLSGSVDSDEARGLASHLAMDTAGVVSVDNLLQVSLSKSAIEHNARIAANVKARDIADSWISTKVRSTFLFSNNITSHDIVVKTHDGLVTLSGNVDSIAERAFAIELAQRVRGVTYVISDELNC